MFLLINITKRQIINMFVTTCKQLINEKRIDQKAFLGDSRIDLGV